MQPENNRRVLARRDANVMRVCWDAVKLFCAVGLAAVSLLAQDRSPAEAGQTAERALRQAIIIDTHADTPQMMLDEGYDLSDPASPYMISIPKMRTGHEGAQFFSIWVPVDWPAEDLIHRALGLVEVVDEQVAKHSDSLEFAASADDVMRIHREGKIAALMGVEGGHIIENDPRMLDI